MPYRKLALYCGSLGKPDTEVIIYGCRVYPEAYAWIVGYNIQEMSELLVVVLAWDVFDAGLYVKEEHYFCHPDIPAYRLPIVPPEAVISWNTDIDSLPTDPSPFIDANGTSDTDTDEDWEKIGKEVATALEDA